MRHLPFVRSIRVHHPDIQNGRANQILFQQIDIVGFLFFRLRMIGAIDNLLAVIRPEWPAIVTEFISQPLHVTTVGIHRVDVQITAALGGEGQLSLAGDGGLGVITANVR